MIMFRLGTIWRDDRGNSFVEMALIAPVLATLLVGTIDISRGVSAKVQAEQAAQRAIELAQSTTYSTSMNSTLQSEAETAAGSGSAATVSAWGECDHSTTQIDYNTGTCNANQTISRYVSVTVQSSFTPLFTSTFFSANSDGTVTVKGYAVVRTE